MVGYRFVGAANYTPADSVSPSIPLGVMAIAPQLFYSCGFIAAVHAGCCSSGGKLMQQDIVAQGVELMLFGMGTVVVFLALLVVATTAMSAFVGRYFPETQKISSGTGKPAAADGEVVAAITAAIHQHRRRKP